MDYSKYFQERKDGAVVFMGDTLEIYISQRYESYGVLTVGEHVETMGIFRLKINGSINTGYFLPAVVSIKPSTIEKHEDINGTFLKLTLYKGDLFLMDRNVVMNPRLGYIIFREFVFLGKKPEFIDYERAAFMFKEVERVAGLSFRTNHVVFETILEHLHRDPNDITKPYRLTSMKNPPIMVPMRSVAHAATSTSGRIVGSFFDDSVNSSIVNQSQDTSIIEDLFRQ